MNNGRIWCVVKPTVGLPAFLGGVAIISLCVHTAVLTQSDWFPAFVKGGKKAVAAAPAAAAPAAAAPAAKK